jgi:outer membrane immunogenic protein
MEMARRSIGYWATLTLVLGGIHLAVAADLPPAAQVYKAPPAVAAYNWTGFYGGLNLGGAWQSSNSTTSTLNNPLGYFNTFAATAVNALGPQTVGTSGVTGGLQVGYNWQRDRILFGLEADIDALSLRGGASNTGVYPFTTATFTINTNVKSDWLATVRGRLGFVAGDWLLFGTGGAAFSDLKASWAFSDTCGTNPTCNGPPAPNAAEAASATTRVGWTVGGGLESKLSERWSWKLEYLYVNFGSMSATGYITPATIFGFPTNLNPFSHNITVQTNIVRAGLNYQF